MKGISKSAWKNNRVGQKETATLHRMTELEFSEKVATRDLKEMRKQVMLVSGGRAFKGQLSYCWDTVLETHSLRE